MVEAIRVPKVGDLYRSRLRRGSPPLRVGRVATHHTLSGEELFVFLGEDERWSASVALAFFWTLYEPAGEPD